MYFDPRLPRERYNLEAQMTCQAHHFVDLNLWIFCSHCALYNLHVQISQEAQQFVNCAQLVASAALCKPLFMCRFWAGATSSTSWKLAMQLGRGSWPIPFLQLCFFGNSPPLLYEGQPHHASVTFILSMRDKAHCFPSKGISNTHTPGPRQSKSQQ